MNVSAAVNHPAASKAQHTNDFLFAASNGKFTPIDRNVDEK